MKKSYVIALSGISCALALICVVGSIFVEFMNLTFAVLAAIFVSMPLTQKSWVGGMLSYISTSIFAFLIGNINALPFILFFGAYAIIQWSIEEKLYPLLKNKIVKYSVGYILKLGYFEAVMAIYWFLFNALIPSFVLFGKTIKLTYLIIALAGIPIFLLYDLMMHLVFKNFTFLINRVVRKTTRTTTPDDIIYDEQRKKQNVFEEFENDNNFDSSEIKQDENNSNVDNDKNDNEDKHCWITRTMLFQTLNIVVTSCTWFVLLSSRVRSVTQSKNLGLCLLSKIKGIIFFTTRKELEISRQARNDNRDD